MMEPKPIMKMAPTIRVTTSGISMAFRSSMEMVAREPKQMHMTQSIRKPLA